MRGGERLRRGHYHWEVGITSGGGGEVGPEDTL